MSDQVNTAKDIVRGYVSQLKARSLDIKHDPLIARLNEIVAKPMTEKVALAIIAHQANPIDITVEGITKELRKKMEPTNRKHVIVHKAGAEGTMEMDYDTGQIITHTDQRPDWADGLVTAAFYERKSWYEQRLGPKLPPEIGNPEAVEFSDLTWATVSDDELAVTEIAFDAEFRSQVLLAALHVEEQEDIDAISFGNTVAEVMIASSDEASVADAQLVDEELSRTLQPEREAAKTRRKAEATAAANAMDKRSGTRG